MTIGGCKIRGEKLGVQNWRCKIGGAKSEVQNGECKLGVTKSEAFIGGAKSEVNIMSGDWGVRRGGAK